MQINRDDWLAAVNGDDTEFFRSAAAQGDTFEADFNRISPLRAAAVKGKLEICRVLLEIGEDVHAVTATGATPLSGAAARGHVDVCKLFVAAGADPDFICPAPEKDDFTPFQFAIKQGRLAVVQYFVEECGVEIEQRTVAGLTLYELAASQPAVRDYLFSYRTEQALAKTWGQADALIPLPVNIQKKGMVPL